MVHSEDVPILYIPSNSPSPFKSPDGKPCISQRREQKGSDIYTHHDLQAQPSDAKTWSSGSSSLHGKPLLPLVDEPALKSPAGRSSESPHSSKSQTQSKNPKRRLSAVFRTVTRAVTFKRKASKQNVNSKACPATYVDKATQTSFENLPPTAKKEPSSSNSSTTTTSALRQYHARIQDAHGTPSQKRAVRPSMPSLQSFLQQTSPSDPGTPASVGQISALMPPRDNVSPKTKALRNPSIVTPGEDQDELQASTMDLIRSQLLRHTQSTSGQSPGTIGTFDSKYSEAPNSNRLPGASGPNLGFTLSTTPLESTRTTPLRDRRAFSDTEITLQDPTSLPSSRVRPPTPMPVDNIPPSPTPSTTSPPLPGRPQFPVLNKGRSADLRRSSPAGRSSPLRQQVEVGDVTDPSNTHTGDHPGPSRLTKTTPDPFDHHARAERQGLPADAFVPPPTPPTDEYMFRRPILDYFSTPEGEAARRRQDEAGHVPDHYQNSPLCPLHPKHRGGPLDCCPIHGARPRTSDGSIDGMLSDMETLLPLQGDKHSKTRFITSRSVDRSRRIYSRRPASLQLCDDKSARHGLGAGAYIFPGLFCGGVEKPVLDRGTSATSVPLGVPDHAKGDGRCPVLAEGCCVDHGAGSESVLGSQGVGAWVKESGRGRRRKRTGSEDSLLRWPLSTSI